VSLSENPLGTLSKLIDAKKLNSYYLGERVVLKIFFLYNCRVRAINQEPQHLSLFTFSGGKGSGRNNRNSGY
jgi:hypothetical protein